jgi:exportin-2 (importin alpha re-exporter)
MLAEYAASGGKQWKAKDCAVYLVVALTVRGKTSDRGATTTNQLVNIGDFFTQQVRRRGLVLARACTHASISSCYQTVLVMKRRMAAAIALAT